MAKKPQPEPQQPDIWSMAWRQAVDLREALRDGFPLPSLPHPPVRLARGETAHAELVLDYSRYYAMDVTYQQSSGFYFGSPLFVAAGLAGDAIGNANRRARAEAMAAPQWRGFQRVVAYLTDRRVLALVDGTRWLSWDHDANMQVAPMLEHWSVVQMFTQTEPLRWQGTAAPWLAVALVYLVYGEEHLEQHPDLRALRYLDG
ncbi:hypothetical protein GCM10027570_38300 [Streptomonospora sediminis]